MPEAAPVYSRAVLVLVQSRHNTGAWMPTIRRMLAPFGPQETQTERYVSCNCLGDAAKKEVAKKIEKRLGKREFISRDMHELGHQSRPVFVSILRGWDMSFNRQLNKHPLAKTPRQTCPLCSGSGLVPKSYNNYLKWEEWQIGGKWHGLFRLIGCPPMGMRRANHQNTLVPNYTILENSIPIGRFNEQWVMGSFTGLVCSGGALFVEDYTSQYMFTDSAAMLSRRWQESLLESRGEGYAVVVELRRNGAMGKLFHDIAKDIALGSTCAALAS